MDELKRELRSVNMKLENQHNEIKGQIDFCQKRPENSRNQNQAANGKYRSKQWQLNHILN